MYRVVMVIIPGADVSRSGQVEVWTHGSGAQVWRVRVCECVGVLV